MGPFCFPLFGLSDLSWWCRRGLEVCVFSRDFFDDEEAIDFEVEDCFDGDFGCLEENVSRVNVFDFVYDEDFKGDRDLCSGGFIVEEDDFKGDRDFLMLCC